MTDRVRIAELPPVRGGAWGVISVRAGQPNEATKRLVQHGNRLTGRSLPQGSLNPDSPLTLDLQVEGDIVTGIWNEKTASEGYYRGARYNRTPE
ncbi:hypothetical protein ABZW47_25870 [Streptomyces sp. NPDC004549]|uniref:hypothetical protein n=1 Tax=Streptomyces sp. NPDC004549 TaxID=3154283 RepID=UPI0033BB681B